MSWATDIATGIEAEKLVLQVIRKKYPCAAHVTGWKGYDLWVPELDQGIEIKCDLASHKSGNIAIEIEMGGNPSALMTSTAEWWAIYDGELICMIRRIDIIYCIMAERLRWVEFTGPADKKPKKAYLIRKETLYSYGHIVNL